MRELHPADRVLRDARRVVGRLENALDAEWWISERLGRAWLDAPLGEREPEHPLCMGIVGRACTRPNVPGTVAVAALRRAMPESEHAMLDETLRILAESQSVPAWVDAPGWTPVGAWRAADVWDSERVLFIDYDGAAPHRLVTEIGTVGGILVETLGVLSPGAAASWAERRDPELVPMPLTERPVHDALVELADALLTTDMTWPRQDDAELRRGAGGGVVEVSCAPVAAGRPGREPMADEAGGWRPASRFPLCRSPSPPAPT